MASSMMIHEERAAGKKIDDGTTALHFEFEQGQYNNALQPNNQQLHSTAPAPLATSQKKEKSCKAVSPTKPRKRCNFDVDFEEIPGSIGRYTCPFGNCIFSNYVFGFETRAVRNKHRDERPYRDDKLHLHVPTDGQMPSAQLINDLVDGFSDSNLKNMLKSLFLKSAGADAPACSSLNSMIMEPGRLPDQYPDHCGALEINSSYYNGIVASDRQSPGNVDYYPTLLERKWTLNSYEEPGQFSFEDYSSKGGGGAFGINNNMASADCGQEQFLENYGAVSSAAFKNNGIMISEGKVSEIAVDNNHLLQDEASKHGFQLGVIEEFLDDKSYLMDDDICSE